MKYLKYFENKTSAEGYKTESWFVGYLDEEDLVLYSGGGEVIKDGEMVMDGLTESYVAFRAEQAGSTIKLAKKNSNHELLFSYDGLTWEDMNTSTTITLSNIGDTVCVRGILSEKGSNTNYTRFLMTGKISASGNCNALWDYRNIDAPLLAFCGYRMFYQCRALISSPELPATTLANYCYHGMFENCTSLTTAPELPATTLNYACYRNMFYKCTSLTTAPELPATTLAELCYSSMFLGCTSLTVAPEILPATELSTSCYGSMFSGCTSLIDAPKISAILLAALCCQNMFSGCTSLTEAPTLPAATLAEKCYSSMFSGCTLLTKAPELPATTLAERCYEKMFLGCSKLTKAPDLPATTLAEYCYYEMFYNCKSLTVAPELPATILYTGCYSEMFKNCANLAYIKCMALEISAVYMIDWLLNAASTGIFVKNSLTTSYKIGSAGIPEGWTIIDA